MAIDANIPLSALQFRMPSPEQQLGTQMELRQFAEMIKQNQFRNQVMMSKEVRAQQELALYRNQERQKASMEQLSTAWKAYESAEGPEEIKVAASKKAWLDRIDEMEKDGTAAALGLGPQDLMRARSNIPSPFDMRVRIESLKDIREQKELKQAAGAQGEVPLNQVGQPAPQSAAKPEPESGPVDRVTGQPIKESIDPKSGAIVRSVDLTPPEGREIKEGEPEPEEQPGPGEQEFPTKGSGKPGVEIVTKPPVESDETPDTLRIQAGKEEARAERLRALGTKTGNAQAKLADDKAAHLRTSASQLQTRMDAESKEERMKVKDKETVFRLAGTQQALPEETLQRIAKQYVAGDHSAMVGMARNQTAQAQIQNAITKEMQAQNKSPEEINAAKLRFTSMMQAERTLGSREANLAIANQELEGFIPLAREASRAVPRSEFLPLSKLETLARSQWSPAQRNLYVRTQGVLNAYAAVISRGVPTVYSQQQAKELLSAADTPQQFEAALQALTSESNIAGRAPRRVRDVFEGEITGKNIKEGGEPPAKPMTYDDPDKERRYREWLRTHPQ